MKFIFYYDTEENHEGLKTYYLDVQIRLVFEIVAEEKCKKCCRS
jgi:hypothetical protein